MELNEFVGQLNEYFDYDIKTVEEFKKVYDKKIFTHNQELLDFILFLERRFKMDALIRGFREKK